MRGPVIARGSRGFAQAAHVYNERFDYVTPLAVARPLDPEDVRGAVRSAVAHGVPLVARSGGHSYAGYSTVSRGAVLMDSYGGAINRVARHATAFVHRDDLYAVQYLTYGGGASWLASTHSRMRPFVSGFAYQNYIDADLKTWRHDYYGSNYPRLLGVQRRVDPHHHFRFPQAIGR